MTAEQRRTADLCYRFSSPDEKKPTIKRYIYRDYMTVLETVNHTQVFVPLESGAILAAYAFVRYGICSEWFSVASLTGLIKWERDIRRIMLTLEIIFSTEVVLLDARRQALYFLRPPYHVLDR
jgi:hypothetical protein